MGEIYPSMNKAHKSPLAARQDNYDGEAPRLQNLDLFVNLYRSRLFHNQTTENLDYDITNV